MASACQDDYDMSDMDDDTATLITQLQMADAEELWLSQKFKSQSGQLTDVEIAIALQKQDLLAMLLTISDRRMTHSIAAAVHTDGELAAGVLSDEEVASRDREFAYRLNGSVAEATLASTHPQDISNDLLPKLAGMYVSDTVGQELLPAHQRLVTYDQSPSSSRRQGGGSDNRCALLHCEACQDDKPYFDVTATSCGHSYCRDCLRNLSSASLTDETLFPPRCCRRNIVLKSVDVFLTKELRERFQQRKIELSTPNRIYCSRPTCSAFI